MEIPIKMSATESYFLWTLMIAGSISGGEIGYISNKLN